MSPRRFLTRHFHKPHRFDNHRLLGRIGLRLHEPELWHFGRRSVAGGVSLGFFLAWVPIPIQMVLAPVLAVMLRVNLPISVAALWVSNPITMAPMFIFAYKVGGWMTGAERSADAVPFDASFSGLASAVGEIWYPLMIGCLVCAVSAAAVGNLSVRWLWRLYLLHIRRKRRNARGLRQRQS